MTDLEMIKLCAEAMGLGKVDQKNGEPWAFNRDEGGWHKYDPLHDDEQAMALVKKFDLNICRTGRTHQWHVEDFDCEVWGNSTGLNRAIVECVAKMQKAKDERPI